MQVETRNRKPETIQGCRPYEHPSNLSPLTSNLIFLVIAITYKSHPRTMKMWSVSREPGAEKTGKGYGLGLTLAGLEACPTKRFFQKPETGNRKPSRKALAPKNDMLPPIGS
jgi:hypothetical protein